jgi:LPXTG-motif cell wall-anchored protein
VKVPSVPQRIRAGKNVSIFAGWSTDGVTVLANIPSVTQGAAYKAVYKAEAAPADIADDPAPAAAELQAVPLPAAAGNSTAAVTAANESAPLAPVPQTGDAAAQAAALLALTALGALVTVLAAAKKRG